MSALSAPAARTLTAEPSLAATLDPTRELEVLLVEDRLLIRRGLELLLRADGMRIAGLAGDAHQALSLIARRRIDVALVAATLGDDRGFSLAAELSELSRAIPVVVYSAGRQQRAVEQMRASGARGLALTASEPSVLLHALRTAAAGGSFVDPALVTTVPNPSLRPKLSPRESQILSMLADGHNGRAIAEALHLSPATVRTHVRNASVKLGARTRSQAVALSLSGGR